MSITSSVDIYHQAIHRCFSNQPLLVQNAITRSTGLCWEIFEEATKVISEPDKAKVPALNYRIPPQVIIIRNYEDPSWGWSHPAWYSSWYETHHHYYHHYYHHYPARSALSVPIGTARDPALSAPNREPKKTEKQKEQEKKKKKEQLKVYGVVAVVAMITAPIAILALFGYYIVMPAWITEADIRQKKTTLQDTSVRLQNAQLDVEGLDKNTKAEIKSSHREMCNKALSIYNRKHIIQRNIAVAWVITALQIAAWSVFAIASVATNYLQAGIIATSPAWIKTLAGFCIMSSSAPALVILTIGTIAAGGILYRATHRDTKKEDQDDAHAGMQAYARFTVALLPLEESRGSAPPEEFPRENSQPGRPRPSAPPQPSAPPEGPSFDECEPGLHQGLGGLGIF